MASVTTPYGVTGQVEAVAELRGRVERDSVGVSDREVTLHRVGADTAGVIESIRSGPNGGFLFRLPNVPNPAAGEEVFFASVEHQGIMYFGPPISVAADLDSLYRIEVYDTTIAPPGGAQFAVETRTLVLERADPGWAVTDLFEIRNDRKRTVVAMEGTEVWQHPLPDGATAFEVGESDITPDVVRLEGGAVKTLAPVPPGLRLYLFRYRLDEEVVQVPHAATDRLEILVREPAPTLAVVGIEPRPSVTPEAGITYRRFAATNVGPATIRIQVSEMPSTLPLPEIGVVLALALGLFAVWGYRRRDDSPHDRRSRLVLEIARLDEAFEREESPSASATRRYRERRRQLAERLRRLG